MDSLKKTEDFSRCYKGGISKANRLFVMYYIQNGTDSNRIGISVSKKTGNSVTRHRLKRQIRESYRLHEAMFNSGLDIAVVVRRQAAESDYHSIESALLDLAGKLGILHDT